MAYTHKPTEIYSRRIFPIKCKPILMDLIGEGGGFRYGFAEAPFECDLHAFWEKELTRRKEGRKAGNACNWWALNSNKLLETHLKLPIQFGTLVKWTFNRIWSNATNVTHAKVNKTFNKCSHTHTHMTTRTKTKTKKRMQCLQFSWILRENKCTMSGI